MSRLFKANQIIELALLLQQNRYGLTIEDIQKEFECSRRSAYRMKDVLSDIFFDQLEEVPTNEKKKRWKLAKGTISALLSISRDDFLNLEQLKELTRNETQKKELDKLILKIKDIASPKNINANENDITDLLEREGYVIRQYSRSSVDLKNLEDIRYAILASKKIKFDYPHKNNRIYSRIVKPYGIIIADDYFLVGFTDFVNGWRMYSLNYMSNFEVLEEYFEPDETFILKEYLANSFGIYQDTPIEVVLEFDKNAPYNAKNYHFHPSQKVEDLPDGRTRVEFTACDMIAMCKELFKWGKFVEIKSPDMLKTFYRDRLEEVLIKYKTPTP